MSSAPEISRANPASFLFLIDQSGSMEQKLAGQADGTFQDVGTYNNIRDRVVNVFSDGDPMPRFDPTRNQPNNQPQEPTQQPTQIDSRGRKSCRVLPGRFHLSTCQRNAQ